MVTNLMKNEKIIHNERNVSTSIMKGMSVQCAELKKMQQYTVIYSDPSSNVGVRECALGKVAFL
jgi:hypothetical protein